MVNVLRKSEASIDRGSEGEVRARASERERAWAKERERERRGRGSFKQVELSSMKSSIEVSRTR